ncbi:hypothetical protein [Acinetobacter nematophilus]|uniref:Uncharacterized protein n=1 Tax=Acinetobacter nematophilus TaxID=2994642 RepID=A0A9X3IFJ4_9GAMM|nr:hypothetical protein [Acinetobacter nematophilus]MCX5466702.1 hypothetical protein [Acinetobacter nematophilus]
MNSVVQQIHNDLVIEFMFKAALEAMKRSTETGTGKERYLEGQGDRAD